MSDLIFKKSTGVVEEESQHHLWPPHLCTNRYTNTQRYLSKNAKKVQVNCRTYLNSVARIMCYFPTSRTFPRNSLVSFVNHEPQKASPPRVLETSPSSLLRSVRGACPGSAFSYHLFWIVPAQCHAGAQCSRRGAILIAFLFLSETNYNISPFPFPPNLPIYPSHSPSDG